MDLKKINTYPIARRKNKFHAEDMITTTNPLSFESAELEGLASAITNARNNHRPIIWMMGGAVIKEGCSLLIIDLMKKGYITHLAMNGSVSIHDFEIAMIGQTSEDVEGGLDKGTFGMVEETGALMNSAINKGYHCGIGYGRSIAEEIERQAFQYKKLSVLYHAYILDIPVTVHVAIGGDIIHQHHSCNGAALGATSYSDFLLFTETMTKIDKGVVLNIGSAVIMPEVFLKALTIARNLGYRHNDFSVANFDFLNMYRPKTRVLEWPQSLGAKAFNIIGRHNRTIPGLYALLFGIN